MHRRALRGSWEPCHQRDAEQDTRFLLGSGNLGTSPTAGNPSPKIPSADKGILSATGSSGQVGGCKPEGKAWLSPLRLAQVLFVARFPRASAGKAGLCVRGLLRLLESKPPELSPAQGPGHALDLGHSTGSLVPRTVARSGHWRLASGSSLLRVEKEQTLGAPSCLGEPQQHSPTGTISGSLATRLQVSVAIPTSQRNRLRLGVVKQLARGHPA